MHATFLMFCNYSGLFKHGLCVEEYYLSCWGWEAIQGLQAEELQWSHFVWTHHCRAEKRLNGVSRDTWVTGRTSRGVGEGLVCPED